MKIHLGLFSTTLTALGCCTSVVHAQDADDYFKINIYGTETNITTSSWKPYDQNQNQGSNPLPISVDDHSGLRTIGNKWSAYSIANPVDGTPIDVHENTVLKFDFKLDEDTEKGFNAVCLDTDLEQTNPSGVINGKCIIMSSSQGWVSGNSYMNSNELTAVGTTSSQSVPIGQYLTGPVNYLVIIQDSDGTNRTIGDSTVHNLQLVDESRGKLKVEINSEEVELENTQLSYKSGDKDSNQDTTDWLMEVSEDGYGIQIVGNQWKALPLPSPYIVTPYTMIEVTATIGQKGEIHSICLDDDLSDNGIQNSCVTLLLNQGANQFYNLNEQYVEGIERRVTLPYGQIRGLTANSTTHINANYLVFVQDNDIGDKRAGRSTFSDIKIYERDERPINMEIFGNEVSIPNVQIPMTNGKNTDVQDTLEHLQDVSADGKSIYIEGNSWKRYKLPEPFTVSKSTVLKFNVTVEQEAEALCVGLLKDNDHGNMNDGRNDVFCVSGTEVTSSNNGYRVIKPKVQEGDGMKSIEIVVGTFFTGEVAYVGLAQDMDNQVGTEVRRTAGKATIMDLEITSLPDIVVMVDGEPLVVENDQQRYFSGTTSRQDTCPWLTGNGGDCPRRDNLMTVSEDGKSITTHGNMWRSIPIDIGKDVGDYVVSFDYILKEPGEIAAICFDENQSLGDYENPSMNKYNPVRCIAPSYYDSSTSAKNNYVMNYEPAINESHRYVARLSSVFDRVSGFNYIGIVADNDQGDKSGGEWTVSNIAITTSLSSCIKDKNVDVNFDIDDCTIDNFFEGIDNQLDDSCPQKGDALLELLALWGFDHEMEVLDKISSICKASYEDKEYDFMEALSHDPHLERQLSAEYIDGGTFVNYEEDPQDESIIKTQALIDAMPATSQIMTYPEDHHALDQCYSGLAMCCWVDSRVGDLEDNTDICYVNMKDSRKTAHVQDGYSIYGDNHAGNVNCQGFAWNTSGGSISNALKGNALFDVGFAHLSDGKREQVPGAPLCGCADRMPVVTEASCTQATTTSTVSVSYTASTGLVSATSAIGAIETGPCVDENNVEVDLKTHYKNIYGEEGHQASWVDTRLVGEGQCHRAINDFLSKKGLVKALDGDNTAVIQ